MTLLYGLLTAVIVIAISICLYDFIKKSVDKFNDEDGLDEPMNISEHEAYRACNLNKPDVFIEKDFKPERHLDYSRSKLTNPVRLSKLVRDTTTNSSSSHE